MNTWQVIVRKNSRPVEFFGQRMVCIWMAEVQVASIRMLQCSKLTIETVKSYHKVAQSL